MSDASARPAVTTPRAGPAILRRLVGLAPFQAQTTPLPATGIHSIVICHLNQSLGNALLLAPLLQALELQFPGAQIDIVTRSPVADELYRGFPQVQAIHIVPSQWLGELPRYLRILWRLRRTRYDLVIDPDSQSKTSRTMIQLCQARYALGYDGAKKAGHLTHPVTVPAALESKGQLGGYLLRTALGQPMHDAGPTPELRLSPAELAIGAQTVARIRSTVPERATDAPMLSLFANATGPKQKDGDWWQRLLSVLEPELNGWTILELIPVEGRSMLADRYPSYYSTDIRKLAAVIAASSVYLSLDCGVMHLASATDTPTLGIFTTTSAAQWGPYGAGNHVVSGYELEPEAIGRQVVDIMRREQLLA